MHTKVKAWWELKKPFQVWSPEISQVPSLFFLICWLPSSPLSLLLFCSLFFLARPFSRLLLEDILFILLQDTDFIGEDTPAIGLGIGNTLTRQRTIHGYFASGVNAAVAGPVGGRGRPGRREDRESSRDRPRRHQRREDSPERNEVRKGGPSDDSGDQQLWRRRTSAPSKNRSR